MCGLGHGPPTSTRDPSNGKSVLGKRLDATGSDPKMFEEKCLWLSGTDSVSKVVKHTWNIFFFSPLK